MLVRYQLFYGWRHLRKSETLHAIGRGIDSVMWVRKIVRHYYHHGVYRLLVGARTSGSRFRRVIRRVVYHVLVLLHRVGLRRGGGETPVR